MTWNPTPGAASYDVDSCRTAQCHWGFGAPVAWHSETADAAWTPLGAGFTVSNPFPNTGHPGVSGNDSSLQPGETTACASAPAATRTARTTSGAYTQLGGVGNAAFTFSGYPAGHRARTVQPDLNIGAGDYGCRSRQRQHQIAAVHLEADRRHPALRGDRRHRQHLPAHHRHAYTHVPAYARARELDELSRHHRSYAWAVLPATGLRRPERRDRPDGQLELPADVPSALAAPVPVAPADSATVSRPPSFQWFAVTGAYRYELTIATSSSFSQASLVNGSPFQTQTPRSPARTCRRDEALVEGAAPTTTAGTLVVLGHASAVPTRCSADLRQRDQPDQRPGIPVFSWDPMPGAISYDVQVQTPGGSTRPTYGQNTTFAPTGLNGLGNSPGACGPSIPTAGPNVPGAYSAWQPFTRSIQPPRRPGHPRAGAPTRSSSLGSEGRREPLRHRSSPPTRPSGTPCSTASRPRTPRRRRASPRASTPTAARSTGTCGPRNDGNQGAWSAPQTLTLPMQLFMSFTGTVHRNVDHDDQGLHEVRAQQGDLGSQREGLRLRCEVRHGQDRQLGRRAFKIKPTCKGAMTFTARRRGP